MTDAFENGTSELSQADAPHDEGTSFDTAELFSFAATTDGEHQGLRTDASEFTPAPMDAASTSRALESANQVTYHWDVGSDIITWSGNTQAVLQLDSAQLSTGRKFATFLDPENFTSRYDTVMRSTQRDNGGGVRYEIEYRFRPEGLGSETAIWLEDAGCWFGSAEAGPQHVYGIVRLADERHQRDQEMNFLSNCDPLTGMMNRGRMSEALGEAISVAAAHKTPCAFALVAVNNLDVMNEAYGFEVADEVIVALGNRLRSVMRSGDAIARYSGSKFGVILNGCKPEELNAALERFMRAVRDSVIETTMGPVWALLSIGAVSLPALGDTAGLAIAHAEEALSEAFRLPSDGFVIYTSSEERKARRMLNARCATEIVSCLREGLFKLAFQPIFNSTSGDVVMHEALLRMADTTGALITAAHLVPIAERLGLIRLIDRAVLQLSLQTLQSYPDAKLSINISGTTVVDPRWNSQLLEMIEAAPEPASRLVIEITETAALDDGNTSRQFVEALRTLGCGVALDDFGAGYTSYRNLKNLPITHIKLDGGFCRELETRADNRIFVQSMVELSHAFGLKVIAEWVEDENDAQILRELGVDCLQGNLYGEATIIAPWAAQQGASFHLAPLSLTPTESRFFEMQASGIEEPRLAQYDMNTDSPNMTAAVQGASNQITALDDDALNAEIEAMQLSEDDELYFEPAIEPDVTPAWETSLAIRGDAEVEKALDYAVLADDTQAAESVEVLAVEYTVANIETPTVETEDEISLDDHLAQLRAALDALNNVFAPKGETENSRLAS